MQKNRIKPCANGDRVSLTRGSTKIVFKQEIEQNRPFSFDHPYEEMISTLRINNMKIVMVVNLKVADKQWFDYGRKKEAADNNVIASVGWLKPTSAEAACRFVADTNGMPLHDQAILVYA